MSLNKTATSNGQTAARCDCYAGHNNSSRRCNARDVHDPTATQALDFVFCEGCRANCCPDVVAQRVERNKAGEGSKGLHIAMYLHCKKCVEEFMAGGPEIDGQSPQTYSRVQAGWTKQGLQVWCFRHNLNIIHIDFEGVKHPAI